MSNKPVFNTEELECIKVIHEKLWEIPSVEGVLMAVFNQEGDSLHYGRCSDEERAITCFNLFNELPPLVRVKVLMKILEHMERYKV